MKVNFNVNNVQRQSFMALKTVKQSEVRKRLGSDIEKQFADAYFRLEDLQKT